MLVTHSTKIFREKVEVWVKKMYLQRHTAIHLLVSRLLSVWPFPGLILTLFGFSLKSPSGNPHQWRDCLFSNVSTCSDLICLQVSLDQHMQETGLLRRTLQVKVMMRCFSFQAWLTFRWCDVLLSHQILMMSLWNYVRLPILFYVDHTEVPWCRMYLDMPFMRRHSLCHKQWRC